MNPIDKKMMNRYLPMLAGLYLLGVLLSSCSLPIPVPVSPDSAAIGVALTERWAGPSTGDEFPEMIHFIRIDGDGDFAKSEEVIRSNYHRGGRIYLLNVKPGRYAMVASSEFALKKMGRSGEMTAASGMGLHRGSIRPGLAGGFGNGFSAPTSPSRSWEWIFATWNSGGRFPSRLAGAGPWPAGSAAPGRPGSLRPPLLAQGFKMFSDDLGGDHNDYHVYTTYFTEELIRKTTVEVRAGEFAVMGDFLIARNNGMLSADKAQWFYYWNIALNMDPWGFPFSNDSLEWYISLRGSLLRERSGPVAEASFLEAAAGDFQGSGWSAILDRSLARLKRK